MTQVEQSLVDSVRRKYTSGNDISVERSWVTRRELDAVLAHSYQTIADFVRAHGCCAWDDCGEARRHNQPPFSHFKWCPITIAENIQNIPLLFDEIPE